MGAVEALSAAEKGLSEYEQATAMSQWFPSYLYALIDKPQELPDITIERLYRHFSEYYLIGLNRLRDEILTMPGDKHQDIFLYICGFPEEDVKDRLDGIYDEVIAILDEHFPPATETIHGERQSIESLIRHFLPLIVTHDGKWKQFAACRKIDDPDQFFPRLDDPAEVPLTVCAGCGVQEQCLSYALEHNEAYGVWGGKTADERREIRKKAHEEMIASLVEKAKSSAESSKVSA